MQVFQELLGIGYKWCKNQEKWVKKIYKYILLDVREMCGWNKKISIMWMKIKEKI